ncbi:MAG TPA: hypothetical protein V6C82_02475, partial [Chroococcales cyanobacterium]
LVSYKISFGETQFQLKSPQDSQTGFMLSQAIHCYARIPEHLRPVVKNIAIDPGSNPMDAYWAKQYNMENFTSAATGANGSVNFYHGTKYFMEDYFNHEFGHNVGQAYSTKNTLIPDNWEAAVKADGQVVTDYAKSSPAESFAEAWMTYMSIKGGQKFPLTEQDFKQKYPNQAKVLESIYSGEVKPSKH